MKSPVISRKDSYIYKNQKEIHKGTKITSNPLKKLADHCVEHKINRRNDEGSDPRSQLYSAWLPFFTLSSLLQASSGFCFWFCTFIPSFAWLFIEKEKKLPDQLAQASWLLRPKETWLAKASWLLAWANGCLKSWENDHCVLPFNLVYGSNK